MDTQSTPDKAKRREENRREPSSPSSSGQSTEEKIIKKPLKKTKISSDKEVNGSVQKSVVDK
jgi:hypothetical protein